METGSENLQTHHLVVLGVKGLKMSNSSKLYNFQCHMITDTKTHASVMLFVSSIYLYVGKPRVIIVNDTIIY